MNTHKTLVTLLQLILVISPITLFAASYNVPAGSNSLVGGLQYYNVQSGDSIAKIAQHYDVGYNGLEQANPDYNVANVSAGTTLKIPTYHLLPNQGRQGLVINLPEMRMYYYPAGSAEVYTYPIGIGKIGRTIPVTLTSVTRKAENPTWVPPDSIREFNLEQGIVLPQVMPPGPDNPLGPYAIYMRVPTYLIHSTIFPESIGKRASFGCIRMFEKDIENFFPSITRGVPVAIINAPTKVGLNNNHLYLEVHPALEEHSGAYDASLPGIVSKISHNYKNIPMLVDWQAVSYIAQERDGIPHNVGVRLQ